MNHLSAAIVWHQLGFAPLPVAPDGSKRPAVQTWTAYQSQRPTLPETVALFNVDHDGIGVICGAVSGGLEMFEAEGSAVAELYVNRLEQAMADHGRAELWDKISSGYCEITPSGGLHWYYRVDGPAKKNTRLARRPATAAELAAAPGNKIKVMIETRGEGGFSVIAPSAGRTHGTGKPWRVLSGTPETIPMISTEDRDALHSIASILDAMPTIEAPQRALTPVGGGVRPGDDFNAKATWAEVIEPHGWKIVAHYGGNMCGWQRPGKRSPGISATSGRNEADNLFVFSTSTEFETERAYSKFSAYALLEHGSDYVKASRALRDKGYGELPPLTAVDLSPFGVAGHPASGVSPFPAPVPAAAFDGSAVRIIEPVQLGAVAAAQGMSEDGTARALAQLHGDRLRFCPQRGWLHWTGNHWQWDTAEKVRELIRSISRDLPANGDWRSYKKRALSSAGVTGIARLAQTDEQLIVNIDELDAHPYELNTPGGIIDLRLGTMRPADPAALHTRTTPVTPDFDRKSELLDQFLKVTFDSDADLIAYVRRLLGLSAIGAVLEQILPFAHGSGANGKSTLIEATMNALGRGESGYAIAVPAEMLLVRKYSEHPAEIAQLAGARMVVCSELDEGQRFAEARIKQLTGGDSINARFMRMNPFTFRPSHTFWLVGNHQPDATTGGPAFWRRLRMVPFEHVVPLGQRDPKLGEKLAAEAPAILAWLAAGAADYSFGGARTPDAVEVATASYASDQDTVGRFVDEQCRRAPGQDIVRVNVTAFRDEYERWCRESGDTAVGTRRLTQELRDRFGVESVKGHNGQRFYTEICLFAENLSATQGGRDDWYS